MEDIKFTLENGKLIIENGVKEIPDHYFNIDSEIRYVELPNSVEKIGAECFRNNEIEEVKWSNNLKEIGDSAFNYNNLRIVELPDSVEKIGVYAFSENNIEILKLPSNIKIIEAVAFQENAIKQLIIPDSVEKIGVYAFFGNKIEYLKLSKNLKIIDNDAFLCNKLKYINIPDSVEELGIGAFDAIDITYHNHFFSEEWIRKLNFQNVIKASKILDIIPNFDFNKINKYILEIISDDNDSIKGYINNYKVFNKLIEKYNFDDLSASEYKDFFKMCFSLGLFHTGGNQQKEVIKFIDNMVNFYTIDEFHQLYTDITQLKPYNKKFYEIVKKEYNHPKLKVVIAKLYNDFNQIIKAIIKGRKEEIGIMNANGYHEKAVFLRRIKKNITIDDIYDYFSSHSFIIKEENSKLKEIAFELSSYVNQEEFDCMQEIYEQSKYVEQTQEKVFNNIIDKNQDGIHYYWMNGNDPINLVLGYRVNCCAKYRGSAQDIMIQSMINPHIKNLVIYNSSKEIIGKSTAYYNKKDKYIVFNNIETINLSVEEQKETLKTILRGIKEQVKEMKKHNNEVEDIRIGMLRNDLVDVIIDSNIEIEHNNLLENYNYERYDGDASDKKAGQAKIKL